MSTLTEPIVMVNVDLIAESLISDSIQDRDEHKLRIANALHIGANEVVFWRLPLSINAEELSVSLFNAVRVADAEHMRDIILSVSEVFPSLSLSKVWVSIY